MKVFTMENIMAEITLELKIEQSRVHKVRLWLSLKLMILAGRIGGYKDVDISFK